jgi:CheY-like chemotaxis protein
LRTPLHAIQGWTNLLMSGALPAAEMQPALKRIERNVQAQARLIEDLLEVSRFAAGKFRLEAVPVDLVTIAEHTIDAVKPAAAARNVSLETQFEIGSAPMVGDPHRLQQVIANLLSNAVKFSEPGGRVTIAIRRDGETCELVVRDQGIGIDAAFLPFVFEAFRQADATTTRAHGGLGLGLSLVKRIVGLHGGEITAASDGPGRGAIFTVHLPFAPAESGRAVAVPLPSGTLANALAGVKILVVDDDADSRDLAATLLESAGARVYRAPSAADALRIIREVSPKVLISDIAMPGQDGHALIQEIRRVPGQGPRVAIAVTAQVTEADRQRALASGFDEHLGKPLDLRALIDVIMRRLSL